MKFHQQHNYVKEGITMKNVLKTALVTASVTALFVLSPMSHAKGDKFSKMDANSDGKISVEEYSAKMKKPERAPKRFARLDTDNDGFLNKEELATKLKKKKKNK